jgi:hypothetical protein
LPSKSTKPYLKNKVKRTGGMAQKLSKCKCKTLHSNPSTTKGERIRKEEKKKKKSDPAKIIKNKMQTGMLLCHRNKVTREFHLQC